MGTLLRAEGATVIGPAEHQLALDLASRERIDVVVVDLNLRGVMSFELLDLLRERSVPFVITTGYMSAIIPAQQHCRVFWLFLGKRTDGPVFLADDRRVSMRHMQRRLAQWFAKAAIVGKSAHSCRHAFASTMLAKTGDLRLVQAALNHSSIVSTTIYAVVDRAKLRAAVGS